jgi:hypothetical protein
MGAMRLMDMTIVKFMFSSVLTGMVGIYLLHDFGLVKLSIKPAILGHNIVGGLLFGAGWGLFGYCPGTSMGALGEGRWDALWGIAGMLIGAGLYAEAYPAMQSSVLVWRNMGKVTLTQLLNVNHWVVIAIVFVFAICIFIFFEKKGL